MKVSHNSPKNLLCIFWMKLAGSVKLLATKRAKVFLECELLEISSPMGRIKALNISIVLRGLPLESSRAF